MKLFNTLTELTGATGQAVSRTVGTVTASVGSVASSVVPAGLGDKEAPKPIRYGSDEAHEQYKAFNTDLNLKLNKLREWNGYLGTAVFWLMAAAMGIATKGVIIDGGVGAAQLSLGALAAGVSSPAFLAVAGITLALGAIKMGMSQYITKVQTEKGMDVSDFHLKREAELVGQEVAKHKEIAVEPEKIPEKRPEMIEASSRVEAVAREGRVAHKGPEAAVSYH